MKRSSANLPPALFVAGTDTGVGKTLISACLLAFFHNHGIRAGYQKWVSTGGREVSEDEALCRRVAPGAFLADSVLHVPYRFSLPASPHLAAELDQAAVDGDYIRRSFAELQQCFPLLVVEGVGGLMVPLSRRLLLADFLSAMRLPALLVCRSGLGTINHCLLSIEAIRSRNIPLIGLVFSDEGEKLDMRIVADNMKTVAEMARVKVLGRLPYCPDIERAVKEFTPIGEALLAAWRESCDSSQQD